MIPLLILALATSGLDSLLALAGFNHPVWEQALATLEGIERERCLWLLGALRPLDLMEVDEATILDHVRGVSLAMRLRPDEAVPEDTLRSFVLHPVAGHFDMLTAWRSELWNAFSPLCGGSVRQDIDRVIAAVRDLVRVEDRDDGFGPPSPPEGTLRRGWGSAREWASLAVASLRSVGIAARLGGRSDEVEAWDGHRWVRVVGGTGTSSTEDPPRERGCVELRLTLWGRAWRALDHVGLAQWSRGAWRPIEPPTHPVTATETDSSVVLCAPAGRYLVTAGVRNSKGEPRAWCEEVTLRPEGPAVVVADLTIPFAEMDRGDLVRPPEPVLTDVLLRDPTGEPVRLDTLVGRGTPVLLCAIEPQEELGERLRLAVEARRIELETIGVRVIVGARDWRPGLWGDAGGLWEALFPGSAPEPPAVVLIGPQGEIALCQRGVGPGVLEAVWAALGALQAGGS